MRNTILFDLGGTLAHYYDMSDFPSILKQSIGEVQLYLDEKGLRAVTPGLIRLRVGGKTTNLQITTPGLLRSD